MNKNDIILYTTSTGDIKVDVRYEGDTFWLTQQQIAELFGVQRPAITKHFGKIFNSGELDEAVVSSILEHTTQHGAMKGKTQNVKTKYYNLDAIISVGYRVNSSQATQFRIWATERLRDYIIKGYAINENVEWHKTATYTIMA